MVRACRAKLTSRTVPPKAVWKPRSGVSSHSIRSWRTSSTSTLLLTQTHKTQTRCLRRRSQSMPRSRCQYHHWREHLSVKSQVAHSAGPPRQETQGPQRPSSAHAAPSLTAPLPVPHLPGIAHFGLKVQVGPLVLKQSLGQTIWPPVSRNRPL